MEFLHDTHIWVLFSFLIFVAVAWKLGRQGVLDKLDTRIAEIRKEIQTAEGLRVEAQEMLAQYQRKQRDALKEAESVIETARDHAAKIRAQAEADLDESMARREEILATRLKRMEEAAIQEIRAHAADLAIEATLQVVMKKLDEKAGGRLIDEAIAGLPGRLN